MLDKITDNMKFFIMILVYVVYITWWASSMNERMEYQMEISQKTVQLLDVHIKECEERKLNTVLMHQTLEYLRHDVNALIEDND